MQVYFSSFRSSFLIVLCNWVLHSANHPHFLSIYQVANNVGPIMFFPSNNSDVLGNLASRTKANPLHLRF